MTNQEFVLQTLFQTGKAMAATVQDNADSMAGTALYEREDYIPEFREACKKQNMLARPVGFVCRSSAGRVVRLLQPYDSNVFTQEPEELAAQWGFKWSQNPKDARPFVAIATSPFMTGDCCEEDGVVYRSTMDNNVHAPSAHPAGWKAV